MEWHLIYIQFILLFGPIEEQRQTTPIHKQLYLSRMAMNVGNEKGTHHGDEAFKMYNLTLDKKNWKCLIPGRFECDGFSNCLTDECGCGRKTTARSETQTPVFYCAQQPGCVTFPQVRKY